MSAFASFAGDDERRVVRAAIDAVSAEAYGLSRELHAQILSILSHAEASRRPAPGSSGVGFSRTEPGGGGQCGADGSARSHRWDEVFPCRPLFLAFNFQSGFRLATGRRNLHLNPSGTIPYIVAVVRNPHVAPLCSKPGGLAPSGAP